ncbi:hypothetical protein HMPREF1866_01244 [Lachnoanaerobaculum saburreum]|uniref:Uncharacterized protein n=1 Tax=Lachnoanaerobaculum saburreum TaxID=467210 RepID=A0A133ZRL3_9FIRM|nr:hypothetical protein HMPREF1866_01244 [Lachnoanaerobaculum saburreum]
MRKLGEGRLSKLSFIVEIGRRQHSKYSSIYKKILCFLKILSYIRLVFGGMW